MKRLYGVIFLLLACTILLSACSKEKLITIKLPSNGGVKEEELKKGVENGIYTSYKMSGKVATVKMTQEQYDYYKNTLDSSILQMFDYYVKENEKYEKVEYNDTFTEIKLYVKDEYADELFIVDRLSLGTYLENYQMRLETYAEIHLSIVNALTDEVVYEDRWNPYDFYKKGFKKRFKKRIIGIMTELRD